MVKQTNQWGLTLYKNDDDKGGAMTKAIEMKKEGEVVVHSHTEKLGRMWSSCLPSKLISLLEYNRGIYEVITEYPHKLYFDIDHHGASDEKFLGEVLGLIGEVFPGIEPAVSGSITDTKTSFHIVAQNYQIRNEKEREQVKSAVRYLTQKNASFDWKVYTKNRNMKAPGQSKTDGRVQRLITYEGDLKAHLITCFLNENVLEYNFPEEVREEIKIQRSKGAFDVMGLPKMSLAFPTEIDPDTMTPGEALAMTPLDGSFDHNYTHRVMRFAKTTGLSFEEYIAWRMRKSPNLSPAEITGLVVKWTGHWNRADKFPPVSFEEHRKMLCVFYPTLKLDTNYRRFCDQFMLGQPVLKIDTITQLCFENPVKCLMFGTGMGSGKTYQTVRQLRVKTKEGKRFIWVAPNRALANNTYARLMNVGIEVRHYESLTPAQKKAGGLINDENLIIVQNSLHYLSLDGKTKTTDILVIDEPETLLNKWYGPFMKDKKIPNWRVFLELMQRTPRVIQLDAFFTKLTVDFNKALGVEMVMYEREKEPVVRTINYLPSMTATHSRIISDLREGKKLFIFYPYKHASGKDKAIVSMESFANTLRHVGEGKKVVMYNADVDEKVKAGLRNVNESWGDVDVVITNSTITCGVNYDDEDTRFDEEYLYISSFSSPRDIIQVSYRPRHLETNRINVCFMGKMTQANTMEDDSDEMKCPIYETLVKSIRIEKFSPIKKTFQLFCSKAYYRQEVDHREIEEQLEREAMDLFDRYKLGASYENVADIDYLEEEVIKQKLFVGTATMEEKYKIQKYHFKKQFDADVDNDFLDSLWNNRLFFFLRKIKEVHVKGADSIFHKLQKHWNSEVLVYLPKKPQLTDELRNQIFSEFKFRFLKSTSGANVLLKEIYNTYFGQEVILSVYNKETKHTTFLFNEFCQINELYEFVKTKSIDRGRWEPLIEWDEPCDFS